MSEVGVTKHNVTPYLISIYIELFQLLVSTVLMWCDFIKESVILFSVVCIPYSPPISSLDSFLSFLPLHLLLSLSQSHSSLFGVSLFSSPWFPHYHIHQHAHTHSYHNSQQTNTHTLHIHPRAGKSLKTLPALTLKVAALLDQLKNAYRAFTNGQFVECRTCLDTIITSIPLGQYSSTRTQ